MRRSICLAAALFGLQMVVVGVLCAETPGRHPAYLHARSDLRAAQYLLRVHDERSVMAHLRTADRAIERAIHEIDKAAELDWKNLNDHPDVDTKLDRPDRLRRAFALLVSARQDIGREEDNRNAVGWRNIASRHIDLAMDQLRRAARELRIDHLEGGY